MCLCRCCWCVFCCAGFFFEYFVLLPTSMCRLHFVNIFMVANHRQTTSAAMASPIGPKVESEEAIFNIRIHNTRCRIECCKWKSGTAPAYEEINRSQELFSDVVLSKNVVVVVVTIVVASSSSSSLHHISWNFFFFCSATFFCFSRLWALAAQLGFIIFYFNRCSPLFAELFTFMPVAVVLLVVVLDIIVVVFALIIVVVAAAGLDDGCVGVTNVLVANGNKQPNRKRGIKLSFMKFLDLKPSSILTAPNRNCAWNIAYIHEINVIFIFHITNSSSDWGSSDGTNNNNDDDQAPTKRLHECTRSNKRQTWIQWLVACFKT